MVDLASPTGGVGLFLVLLALQAFSHLLFDVLIEARPPHVASTQTFHPCDAGVALIQDCGASG